MTEPRIVQHDSAEEIDGGYAYYDKDKNEIHILKPEALYQRILDHEKGHANLPTILRAIAWISDATTLRASILLMIYGIIFVLIIHFWPIVPITDTFLILAGAFMAIPVLLTISIGTSTFEEFFAERYAIAKSKQPQADNP